MMKNDIRRLFPVSLSANMVRPFLTMILCMLSLILHAQNMSVASFKMDESDQTANLSPTMMIDLNGEKCALIKVITSQKGFTFDVGALGIRDIQWQNEQHPSEIWIYVPNGVRKISIQHPQFKPIKDYDFQTRLKKGRTYLLELTSDQVNTLIVDYENSQVLDVNVHPADADLFINGIRQNLDPDGSLSIPLPFGTHNYRVTANNYHPQEGQVIVNDKENKHHLDVKLRQAFGYLNTEPTSESRGAEIFIDNQRAGVLPVYQLPVASGEHEISLRQKLYLPYTEKVTITDSATVTLKPVFIPNYAEYEILIDGDKEATIYDNGEMLGTGQWKGKLEAGTHIIEARKASHATVSRNITVEKGVAQKISLSKPSPIYGTLEVKTTPENAVVFLDNERLGSTPLLNDHILIGPHKITLQLAGHKPEQLDITIQDGQTEYIAKNLIGFCDATIYSNPVADILIDGVEVGRTPHHINKEAGDYQIELSAKGYTPYSKRMRLDGTTADLHIKLHRDYIRSSEVYVQVGYTPTCCSGINLGMGLYAKNINFEANYILGLSESEPIYWSDSTGERVPFAAKYKPQGGNIKAGYGIRLNSRFRITPQLGCQFISLKEKTEAAFSSSDYSHESEWYLGAVDKAGAASLSLDLRCNAAIAGCVGLSVTPEYLMPISKSAGYKALSDISSKIKGYCSGFNLNVSLNLFF